MNTQLRAILLQGPITVGGICEELGQSKSKVLKLLKEDQGTIHVRKEEGQNLYWLPAEGDTDDDFEASETELAAQAPRQDIQERNAVTNPPAETPAAVGPSSGANTCPLCQAEADQVQAGPEGSYLGAARTCAACKKTYNVFTKEEVKMAKNTEGTKRAAPLNPQYKINAKIAGAEAAGGKLVYQREGRTWLLTKRGVEPKQMTATEFSVETVESIQKYLGFTPPPAAPKAEKVAKASSSGSKGSKSGKTTKATGSGAKGKGKGGSSDPAPAQAEQVDELVG